MASTDAGRLAESTMPLPIAVCGVCEVEDRHVWSEVEREGHGRVVLRRLCCVCEVCGRCDARLVLVTITTM